MSRVSVVSRPGAAGAGLSFVAPMIPTLVDEPPAGEGWLHEIKLDGYRTQFVIERGRARAFTRNGLDWTEHYPLIAVEAQRLACRSAIIDGETIVQDAEGHPDFGGLRSALTKAPERILFFAFDLLHLDGEDLRKLPLIERRARLVALLAPHVTDSSRLQLSEAIEGEPGEWFSACADLGLEGLVSKRADSRYASGRTFDWLKAKCMTESELVIIGTDQDTKTGAMRLLLVSEDEGDLVFRGAALLTLPHTERRMLRARPAELALKRPPIPRLRKAKAAWVRPEISARVRHVKSAGKLRHASVREVFV